MRIGDTSTRGRGIGGRVIGKRDAEKSMRRGEGLEAFQVVPLYERLLLLQASDFDKFMRESSPATRLTLGYYEAAKRRQAQLREVA